MYKDLQLPSDFLIDNHKSLSKRRDFEDLCESLDDIYYGIKEYSHSINTNSSIVVPIQMKELEEALGFNASELVGYMQQNYSLDGYILKVGV